MDTDTTAASLCGTKTIRRYTFLQRHIIQLWSAVNMPVTPLLQLYRLTVELTVILLS